MPFTYRDTTDPRYAANIGDLMIRRGDIAAQQAREIANAQARAVDVGGQAAAGAAQAIGAQVAAIPQQIQKQKQEQQQSQINAQQLESGALKLKEQKSDIADHDIFKKILKETPPVDENGMKLYDLPTLASKATAAGLDPAGYLEHYANVNNGFRNEYQARVSTVQAGAKGLMLAPDPVLALDFLKRLEENHTISSDVHQHLSSLIEADPSPQNVLRIATPFAGEQKPIMGNPGATPLNPITAQPMGPPLPDKPTKAGLAVKAAAGDATAQAALDKMATPKNPPPIEEQLLEAIAKGDTVKADQIKQTLKTKADATKDPAQQALANELGHLRKEEAQARLTAMQKKAEPLDVSPDIQTTRAGRSYIDLSQYSAEQRDKAREAASAAGAVSVSKEQANALQEIDNARMNQKSILQNIEDILPKDPAGRVIAAVTVPLSKVFQTNEQIAAFNSWRTAAIQTLRATAGSKGLRINEAEIKQAVENDIPKLTDTVKVAQRKVKTIETMLENAEQSILVRDRQTVPSAVSDLLKGAGPGRHTLSDGSVWDVDATGKPTKVK